MTERRIIDRRETTYLTITLAEVPGCQPYVTWASRKDAPDDTFWGHYFHEEAAALKDFAERLERRY